MIENRLKLKQSSILKSKQYILAKIGGTMKYNKKPTTALFINKCFHINGVEMNKNFKLNIDDEDSYELVQFLTEINSKRLSNN